MKSLEYVVEHYDEFEEDNFFDRRWTKRFLNFLPLEDWGKYGFGLKNGETHTPVEWTEKNILKQLKEDVEFGAEKARYERAISSELMAQVVNAWCKVLENGLDLNGNDGWYHHKQFEIVAEHYGWQI